MRKIRVDADGDGHFGAPRGNRLHTGIDRIYLPDEEVEAEITGTVRRIVLPYEDDFLYTGLEIVSPGLIAHQMYVIPLKDIIGKQVYRGDIIGYAQNICRRYPNCKKMLNHTHNTFYIDFWELENILLGRKT